MNEGSVNRNANESNGGNKEITRRAKVNMARLRETSGREERKADQDRKN